MSYVVLVVRIWDEIEHIITARTVYKDVETFGVLSQTYVGGVWPCHVAGQGVLQGDRLSHRHSDKTYWLYRNLQRKMCAIYWDN